MAQRPQDKAYGKAYVQLLDGEMKGRIEESKTGNRKTRRASREPDPSCATRLRALYRFPAQSGSVCIPLGM